jgi:hypothetical protein
MQLRQVDMHWREVDGEIVALDLTELRYFGINRTGRELWQDLLAGATREHLIDVLRSSYDLEYEHAASDVDAFVAELRSHHLLASENDRNA